ncbi:hypothetical protein EAG_07887 [Camponotus floridanus]|uniref:Uncharacterized protein n=1 Tax=Camponotus floridanus TaxID=104421 RepID=E2A3J6_CAMFO|nr:hypothetical protein EAG_07887 [Camponotus floridanus]
MVVLQVTYLRLATLKISCDSVLWIYGKSSSHVKANYGCKSEMGIIVTEMEITMNFSLPHSVGLIRDISHVSLYREERLTFWSYQQLPNSPPSLPNPLHPRQISLHGFTRGGKHPIKPQALATLCANKKTARRQYTTTPGIRKERVGIHSL